MNYKDLIDLLKAQPLADLYKISYAMHGIIAMKELEEYELVNDKVAALIAAAYTIDNPFKNLFLEQWHLIGIKFKP